MVFSQNKPLILFDLDGTLVDTAPDLVAAANHCLISAGLQRVDEAILRPFAGVGGVAMLEAGFAFNKQNFKDTKLDLIPPFLAHYKANIAQNSKLFPNMDSLLVWLERRDAPMAICTNKPGNLARLLVEKLGLEDYFPTIVGGDDCPYKKPDPRPLLAAKRQRAPNAETCIYIGDSEVDMIAAKAAGMIAIGVDYGYSAKSLSSSKPDQLVQNVTELQAVLQTLLPASG